MLISVLIGAELAGVLGALARDPGRRDDPGAPDRVAPAPACAAGRGRDHLKSLVRAEVGRAGAPITVVCARSLRLAPLRSLLLGSAQQAAARPHAMQVPQRQKLSLFLRHAAVRSLPARPRKADNGLRALELTSPRASTRSAALRGLRPLVGSRWDSTPPPRTTPARWESRDFFEHESLNGAPFWKRIERFYPMGRGSVVGRREHSSMRPRHERGQCRRRVDEERAAPAEHPRARVARDRNRGRALRRCSGRLRRPCAVTIVTADFRRSWLARRTVPRLPARRCSARMPVETVLPHGPPAGRRHGARREGVAPSAGQGAEVRLRGFEPPTNGLEGRRSSLSYRRPSEG